MTDSTDKIKSLREAGLKGSKAGQKFKKLLCEIYAVAEEGSLPSPHLKIWQIHHGYIGVVMFLIGLIGILSNPEKNIVRIVLIITGGLGSIFGIDDLVQHSIQLWKPMFRSPINWLYGRILRLWNRIQRPRRIRKIIKL